MEGAHRAVKLVTIGPREALRKHVLLGVERVDDRLQPVRGFTAQATTSFQLQHPRRILIDKRLEHLTLGAEVLLHVGGDPVFDFLRVLAEPQRRLRLL